MLLAYFKRFKCIKLLKKALGYVYKNTSILKEMILFLKFTGKINELYQRITQG